MHRCRRRLPSAVAGPLLLPNSGSFGRNTVPTGYTAVGATKEDPNDTSETKERNVASRVIHLYTDYASRLWKDTSQEARDEMSHKLSHPEEAAEEAVVVEAPPPSKKVVKPKSRSIAFGALMGVAVAAWVFSGNYIFTALFTSMTILGQLEYYRMVMSTGVYPARRISVVGACSMFVTALVAPELHQICLPMFGMWAMVWFLTMKRNLATIPEIGT